MESASKSRPKSVDRCVRLFRCTSRELGLTSYSRCEGPFEIRSSFIAGSGRQAPTVAPAFFIQIRAKFAYFSCVRKAGTGTRSATIPHMIWSSHRVGFLLCCQTGNRDTRIIWVRRRLSRWILQSTWTSQTRAVAENALGVPVDLWSCPARSPPTWLSLAAGNQASARPFHLVFGAHRTSTPSASAAFCRSSSSVASGKA